MTTPAAAKFQALHIETPDGLTSLTLPSDPAGLDADFRMMNGHYDPGENYDDAYHAGGRGHRERTLATKAPFVRATIKLVNGDKAAQQSAQTRMNALSGKDRRIVFSAHEDQLIPSADNPLLGTFGFVNELPRGSVDDNVLQWALEIAVIQYEELSAPLTAPASVTAGPGAASGELKVEWDADAGYMTEFPQVLKVLGYNVYYSAVSGGPYTKATTTRVANAGVGKISYTIPGLTPATPYFAVVVSDWGFGAPSSPESTEATGSSAA